MKNKIYCHPNYFCGSNNVLVPHDKYAHMKMKQKYFKTILSIDLVQLFFLSTINSILTDGMKWIIPKVEI